MNKYQVSVELKSKPDEFFDFKVVEAKDFDDAEVMYHELHDKLGLTYIRSILLLHEDK